MDEVPAIIHRLSLRLWVPEYGAQEDEELARNPQNPAHDEKVVDPLGSPPQDPVDSSGHILDPWQIASLSLNSGSETHSLFSQKNLLRLGALANSHRTLSLFTPSIRDAVFRAWAGPTERGEGLGSSSPVTPRMPTLSRAHSYTGSTSTTYVFSDGAERGSHLQRPSLSSFGSAATGLGLGSTKRGKPHGGRKRKHRIVNLRKKVAGADDFESISGEGSTTSETVSSAPSEYGLSHGRPHVREDELLTPPRSPEKMRLSGDLNGIDLSDTPPRMRNATPRKPPSVEVAGSTPRPSGPLTSTRDTPSSASSQLQRRPKLQVAKSFQEAYMSSKKSQNSRPSSPSNTQFGPQVQPLVTPLPSLDSSHNGIFEHAWMMKMAGEIARRVHDEKAANSAFWERGERDDTPPPAYGS